MVRDKARGAREVCGAGNRDLLDKSASPVSDVAGGPEDRLHVEGIDSVDVGAARLVCGERTNEIIDNVCTTGDATV